MYDRTSDSHSHRINSVCIGGRIVDERERERWRERERGREEWREGWREECDESTE